MKRNLICLLALILSFDLVRADAMAAPSPLEDPLFVICLIVLVAAATFVIIRLVKRKKK